MTLAEVVRENLVQLGLPLHGIPVADSEDPKTTLASIRITRDSRGRQSPTHLELTSAKTSLEAMGCRVEFLLFYEQAEDLEGGLRATLLTAFPSHVRNVFTGHGKTGFRVWIESKTTKARDDQEKVFEAVSSYFSTAKVPLRSISWLSDGNIPSKLALLNAIRLLAPVSTPALAEYLRARLFEIPSPDWMNRNLDKLRKSGDITLIAEQKYVLPIATINRLGTRKERSSPDIARMLALRRRNS